MDQTNKLDNFLASQQKVLDKNKKAEEIDEWFDKIQVKLGLYKESLIKEKVWKRQKNRKKGKLFRLRKKIKRLKWRLAKIKKETGNDNRKESQNDNQLVQKKLKKYLKMSKIEQKTTKQDLKCLNLVKSKFSTNKLKEEIRLNRSKKSADDEKLKKWKTNLIQTLFGRDVKLSKLTKTERRSRNYYRCASISLDNLVRVRQLWDKYINPNDGSSVPLTYVLTDFQPNDQWKKYLDTDSK